MKCFPYDFSRKEKGEDDSLSLSLSGNDSKTENRRGDETKLRPPTGLLKP
jgi:hypothetical protein